MLKVGLTGGIGSGKTTVSKILINLGLPVYNSDQRAKWLMNNDPSLKEQIINLLGKKAYTNEILNKSFISDIVFHNSNVLKQLNNLVHPKVAQDFKIWLLSHSNSKIIFKEAAILIESKAYLEMDKIILITCPKNIRIKRILKRDLMDQNSILKRIDNQMSDTEKLKYADYIIKNNGNRTSLKNEVQNIIDQLF